MGDVVSWFGVLISALSLVVAIVAIVKSGRAQREANAAQRRIVEIEEQRERDRQTESNQANLRAETRITDKSLRRLCLVNDGAVEAQNIRIELDDKPLAEHPAVSQGNLMPDLLGPRSEAGCLIILSTRSKPPRKIKITWDDASGNDRNYRSSLTW